HFRFSGIVTVFYLGLFFLHLPFSAGQDIPEAAIEGSGDQSDYTEPLKVLVSVNEVRLDVVVVDNKGRPITDLTVADFEINQDRQPQQAVSAVYINNQTVDAPQPAVSRKDTQKPPRSQAPALKEEDVRRTILFVVDNLSMQFQHLSYAKTAIKNFTEKQMQPNDLVAVLRTGYGNSALDFFSSDKRQIMIRTNSIPYQGLLDEDYQQMVFDNQISALSYSIRALKDMPGRKVLFFMTSAPYINSKIEDDLMEVSPFSVVSYIPKYNRLADEALRAGVVVHLLDARGLEYYEPTARDIEKRYELNPMPAKTGGIYVTDQNFFLNGIGRDADNMIAGYYLVTYAPPPNTFNLSRRDVFHRVKIRVKRKGAVVYTRDGFYGRTESETDSAAQTASPLQKAIFSPFKYADLNVNIASGYIKDAVAGYFVRSWIHVDPGNVTIVETENDGARINIETVCLTSDINGHVHDFVDAKYTFDIDPEKKSENLAWIQKHGIRFSLLLPVKKPGYYTVRIAVQDSESGKVGSAWQSMEIPDLKKKGLALSNIFMITSADDLNWMRSDVTKGITEGIFSMMFQEEGVRSPALRTYMPGDRLQTLAILYNADAKAIARSEIEIRYVLHREGNEFLRGEPKPVSMDGAANPDGILVLQQLMMGSDLTPGDYILELRATDKNNSKKKEGAASEILGFTLE
ncbi:MAG: VWA domain-containing protein, partial [Acidobacteria bacterium]|nr:VWA domain-containing protein [Acidobacteriota bacterium]